eukprot:CAMPEP_0170628986 /NCGR_PEP_ID=MMETSP0224-20130122/33045_1 /TAXON_ID=285029 /ORGANISM="Togula jolla, Strain CCCM 725" /LENGTH=78 /DNA_ID=CAMNT_0010956585 /DNA_START=60 /DNA_END=296 /DNA_ORIENTATION=+
MGKGRKKHIKKKGSLGSVTCKRMTKKKSRQEKKAIRDERNFGTDQANANPITKAAKKSAKKSNKKAAAGTGASAPMES